MPHTHRWPAAKIIPARELVSQHAQDHAPDNGPPPQQPTSTTAARGSDSQHTPIEKDRSPITAQKVTHSPRRTDRKGYMGTERLSACYRWGPALKLHRKQHRPKDEDGQTTTNESRALMTATFREIRNKYLGRRPTHSFGNICSVWFQGSCSQRR